MNTTLAAKVGGGAVVLTGTGIGGTYIATKESVKSKVGDSVLTATSDEKDWEIAQKHFKDKNINDIHEKFKQLKTDLDANKTEASLKSTCISVYQETYGNAFSKDEDLVKEVKKYCSKIEGAIWYSVKEDVLPENLETTDKAWKEAQDILKADSSQSSSLVTELKNLYDSLQTGKNNATNNDGNPLKETCRNIYSKVISDTASKTKYETQTKKYCSLTIKDKLGSGKTFDDAGDISASDSKLSGKMGTLVEADANEDSGLKANFKTWKESASNTTIQKEFRDWCQTLYPKHYKGAKDNNWKLAKKYCEKTSG